MRILLDECIPRRLGADFSDHAVRTVPAMGWSGVKNGALLRLANGQFDALITVDRNMAYQQDLSGAQLAVIALGARTNRLEDLRPLVSAVKDILRTLRPGEFHRVSPSTT